MLRSDLFILAALVETTMANLQIYLKVNHHGLHRVMGHLRMARKEQEYQAAAEHLVLHPHVDRALHITTFRIFRTQARRRAWKEAMDVVLDRHQDLGGSRGAELVLVLARLVEVALDRVMCQDQAQAFQELVLGHRPGQLIGSSRMRDGQNMGRGLRGRSTSSRGEQSNCGV
jgi:hypothetical protein